MATRRRRPSGLIDWATPCPTGGGRGTVRVAGEPSGPHHRAIASCTYRPIASCTYRPHLPTHASIHPRSRPPAPRWPTSFWTWRRGTWQPTSGGSCPRRSPATCARVQRWVCQIHSPSPHIHVPPTHPLPPSPAPPPPRDGEASRQHLVACAEAFLAQHRLEGFTTAHERELSLVGEGGACVCGGGVGGGTARLHVARMLAHASTAASPARACPRHTATGAPRRHFQRLC